MTEEGTRKHHSRIVPLDRALESLPLFRLSDSSDSTSVSFEAPDGARWRVLSHPGERIPGTFDQDVYIEILRRYHEADSPADGGVTFTLHSFLRSIGRRADGRTYEQLRASISRLERTILDSGGVYFDAKAQSALQGQFSILSSATIQRRRRVDRYQLSLFPAVSSAEPGVARVAVAPLLRSNIERGHISLVDVAVYYSLQSAVARRLYRLIQVARTAEGEPIWRISGRDMALLLPLAQRYRSHLLRVIQPANEMLVAAGVIKSVVALDGEGGVMLEYVLAAPPVQSFSGYRGKDLA